jgi:hypothetical protein
MMEEEEAEAIPAIIVAEQKEPTNMEPFDKQKCIAFLDLNYSSIKSMRSTVPPDLKRVGISEKEWIDFIDNIYNCLFPKGLSVVGRMGNLCYQPEEGEQLAESEHFLTLVRQANNKFESKKIKLVLETRDNKQTRIVIVKND